MKLTLRAWTSHPSHVKQRKASKNRRQSRCFTTGCSWAAFVSGDAALKPLPVALVRGAALNTGTRTLVSELGPESAPGSPLGARSRPPPPRPAVTPALGATGREWRRDGRPRAGAGAERLRWGGRSAQSRPARRRRRRGARREPQSGRRHFSLRQRRGLGRGDWQWRAASAPISAPEEAAGASWTRGSLWSRWRCRSPWPTHRSSCRSGGVTGPGGAGSVPVRVAGNGQAAPLPSQQGRRLQPEPPDRAATHGLSPQRMTDKCFRKCIGKPGGALDNSEQVRTGGRTGHPRTFSSGLPLRLCVPQKCIAMCMDRYMDSWNTVSRAYNSRLQRERANMWRLPASGPRRDHVGKGQRPVQVVRGESCCLPSPCRGRAIKPRWTFCIHWLLLAPAPGESDFFFPWPACFTSCPSQVSRLAQGIISIDKSLLKGLWQARSLLWKMGAKPSQQHSTLAWDSSMDPSIRSLLSPFSLVEKLPEDCPYATLALSSPISV